MGGVLASLSAAWIGNLGQQTDQTPCRAGVLQKNLRDRAENRSFYRPLRPNHGIGLMLRKLIDPGTMCRRTAKPGGQVHFSAEKRRNGFYISAENMDLTAFIGSAN
jgi:hypothetical protein